MSKLNIIHASAGSGKTHFLTEFYLKTIIKEPVDYFGQILAVTFTNRATAEMKRRILYELDRLAKNEPSDYLQLLINSTGYQESQIRGKCALIKRNILHDYSWFSVETIDSFFQRIIRGFTHEIGVPGNYLIELETQPVLEFAVDRLLNEVNTDSENLSWLVNYAGDRIQQGKAWEIRNSLIDLGAEIFREKFNENASGIIAAVSDRKELNRFRNDLMKVKFTFESRVKEMGNKGITIITEAELTDDDFFQKSNGPGKFFAKFRAAELKNTYGELLIHSATANKLLESAENWPSGTTQHKNEVLGIAEQKLLPLLREIRVYTDQHYTRYITAVEILKNIFATGILADLAANVKTYRIERNIFILSDAPVLINRIIDQNDTPFIYEKMGNRYSHFLIDEFQDTSALQWKNFKPFISNALSMGKDNLLVGDAKQSIYRWRNSNWEILARLVGEEYPAENLHFEELKINWRSGERIVRFINSIFPAAVKNVKNKLLNSLSDRSEPPDELQLLESMYGDVVQEIPNRNMNRGNVFIRFFSKKEINGVNDYYHEVLISQINSLLKKGYSADEIAILVRKGEEGQQLANLLIECNAAGRFEEELNILTEESLFLNASNAVNLVIAAMQYLYNPEEEIVQARLIVTYEASRSNRENNTEVSESTFNGKFFTPENLEKILPAEFTGNINGLISLSLYDLAERLVYIFKLQESLSEIPYVHALLDLVHEYTATYPGHLGSFLEYWEDKGQSKTIPAGDSLNAVRILTIHKSKGLEFKAVIIPFCSWKLDQRSNVILWAEAKGLSFNYLPIVPVNYHRGLKYSEFAPVYFTELIKSHIDNLNLLYVALTRAKESLIVFPVYNDTVNNHEKISTVGDLLYESIVRNDDRSVQDHFNPATNTLEIVSEPLSVPSEQKADMEEQIFIGHRGTPASERFYFSKGGNEYFADNQYLSLKGIRRGSVLHGILAAIETQSDIDRIIGQAVLDGLIANSELQQLKNHILQCFDEKLVFSWFDGSGKVYTEKEILLQNGDFKRPDRVVFHPESVHVIDYKFGNEQPVQKNRQQVREYVAILQSMGYKGVQGFLWYIDQNKVITV
jgi:ATP-dependent helicase/nuclease subunit A